MTFLDQIGQKIGASRTPVTAGLTKVQSEIKSYFDNVISQLDTPLPPQIDLNLSQYTDPVFDKLKWLIDKVEEFLHSLNPDIPGFPSVPQAVKDLFQEIINICKTLVDTMTNLEGQFIGIFQGLNASPIDPRWLAVQLLRVLEKLVLTPLTIGDEVVTTFFSVLADLIQGIKDFLNTKIDIPGISTLFSQITDGEDLTLLNLGTLMIAVPYHTIRQSIGTFEPKKLRKALHMAGALTASSIHSILDITTAPETEAPPEEGGFKLETIPEAIALAAEIVAWAADAPGEGYLEWITTPHDNIEKWENAVYAINGAALVMDGISIVCVGAHVKRAEMTGVILASLSGAARLGLISQLVSVRTDSEVCWRKR